MKAIERAKQPCSCGAFKWDWGYRAWTQYLRCTRCLREYRMPNKPK